MSAKMYVAPVAALLTLTLTACGASGSPAPTVTVTATVTTTATVEARPSPTPTPTPVSAQVEGHLGMVWASQVDPGRINQPIDTQPTFDGGDGVTVRIENLLYADASVSGDIGDECAAEIEFRDEPSDTHCLFVQWSFDVPDDYEADDASLSPGPLLTPSGRQIGKATTTSGVPGAKNVVMVEIYAGGVPGSTLRWDVGSNAREWKTLKYEVPGADGFLPINFS